MATPYVKFYRGTPEAFKNLAVKNNDTLYFISKSDDAIGQLYLGDKLISDNITSLTELKDIVLTSLTDKDLLIYNAEEEKWVNKSIVDAIGIMLGASEEEQGSNGLVPAPGKGMQNAFLRGDGQWVEIEVVEGNTLTADEKSISIQEEVITLKDFGVKYYKFIAETGSEETGDFIAAHYEAQIVDAQNPWKEGLEPKVVKENGELILGWFEPNSATVEGITEQVLTLQSQVDDLAVEIAGKVSADVVYTKEQTEEKINSAIAKANHLIRKVFATIEEAESFALIEGEEAVNYVYMVATNSADEHNKYEEYLWQDGKLELVGNWAVDLTDYATKDDLGLKVDKVDGKSLVLDTEIAKLVTVKENAEPNFIKSVNTEELKVDNGLLSVISIASSKVIGLEELLNGKANNATVEEVSNKVSSLEESLGAINSKVNNLEDSLKDYVTFDDLENELAEIKDAITWKTI